ncbi:MAG TPA: CHASE2 domain-containing protein [Candidatus Cybelea sp.]|jgi:hypothetical protein|nr:CHASE2 domain-containing protein [Candidatus Cybelea sp.]
MFKSFRDNVVVGLILYAICLTPVIQQNRAINAARDALVTWDMNRLAGTHVGSRVAWIDVDEGAQASWGVPYQTARDKLLKLVKWAQYGQPAAILIDIDLTKSMRGYPGDDALTSFLAECQSRRRQCAPMLLVRTLGRSAYVDDTREHFGVQAEASFLDRALHTSPREPWTAGSVRWGTSGMDRDSDGIVRRWRVWETSCSGPGESVVIPSVILLAAAIATHTAPQAVHNAVEPHELWCFPAGTQSPQKTPAIDTTLELGGYRLPLTQDDLQRRVFYRMTWSQDEQRALGLEVYLPADTIARLPGLDRNETPGPQVIAAAKNALQGRIVVIGASNEAAGDLWVTPVGLMPGALVIINAIDSVLEQRTLREPPAIIKVPLEILVILIVSALFAALSGPWGLRVSLAAMLLATVSIGLFVFNYGIWIDSVVPVLGIILHEAIETARHRKKRAAV